MFEYQKFLKDESGLTTIELACLISISMIGLYFPLAIVLDKLSMMTDTFVSALTIT